MKGLKKKILEYLQEYIQMILAQNWMGVTDWAPRGVYDENFEKVIEEVDLNEISKPFETAFGWHILKVLEKRKKNISDEIIKDKAYSVLFKRKFQEQLQNTLEEIRSEAFVDIKISSI